MSFSTHWKRSFQFNNDESLAEQLGENDQGSASSSMTKMLGDEDVSTSQRSSFNADESAIGRCSASSLIDIQLDRERLRAKADALGLEPLYPSHDSSSSNSSSSSSSSSSVPFLTNASFLSMAHSHNSPLARSIRAEHHSVASASNSLSLLKMNTDVDDAHEKDTDTVEENETESGGGKHLAPHCGHSDGCESVKVSQEEHEESDLTIPRRSAEDLKRILPHLFAWSGGENGTGSTGATGCFTTEHAGIQHSTSFAASTMSPSASSSSSSSSTAAAIAAAGAALGKLDTPAGVSFARMESWGSFDESLVAPKTFSFGDEEDSDDHMSLPIPPKAMFTLTKDIFQKQLPLTSPPLLRRDGLCITACADPEKQGTCSLITMKIATTGSFGSEACAQTMSVAKAVVDMKWIGSARNTFAAALDSDSK